MKKLLLACVGLAALSGAVLAQTSYSPTGQSISGQINQTAFAANTNSVGFASGSTAQPVAAGTVTGTATVLPAAINYVTCSSGQTALRLPAVQVAVPIKIINRSGTSCLIFPTTGDVLETALGTVGAANASYTMATSTDVTFMPVIIAGVATWLQ